jgi:hypothetical protein
VCVMIIATLLRWMDGFAASCGGRTVVRQRFMFRLVLTYVWYVYVRMNHHP